MSFTDLTYHQRLALLQDPEFLEAAAEEEQDARTFAGLDGMSRADKCIRPLVQTRYTVPFTGVKGTYSEPLAQKESISEPEQFLMPCGSANADVCPECAEFAQRLRMRQILRTLGSEASTAALFTLTAPSFGAVHRSYWSAKDAYRVRSLPEAQKEARRLLKMRNASPCPCSQKHTYQEEVVGTPVKEKTYDYSGEIIWSQNLPALVKSAVRKIKTTAEASGISKESLRLFTVYERQGRGSLHTHMLIVVERNPRGFARLVSTIRTTWNETPPTAAIPSELVEWLRSTDAEEKAVEALGLPFFTRPLADSIPVARWKGGAARPATTFGKVYDIRVIEAREAPTAEDDAARHDSMTSAQTELENEGVSHVDSHGAAAAYISKYLTKNQSAFSTAALIRIGGHLAQHYRRFRLLAFAILSDKVLLDSRRSTVRAAIRKKLDLEDEAIDALISAPVPAWLQARRAVLDPDGTRARINDLAASTPNPLLDPELNMLLREQAKLKTYSVARHPLATVVQPILAKNSLTRAGLIQCLDVTNDYISLRGVRTRFNRLADNGGFSGVLTSTSNWGCSLASLKTEMRAWAEATYPTEFPVEEGELEFVWFIDSEAMEYELKRRKPPLHAE